MKKELDSIYKEIWEESKNKYPSDIMNNILNGGYKN